MSISKGKSKFEDKDITQALKIGSNYNLVLTSLKAEHHSIISEIHFDLEKLQDPNVENIFKGKLDVKLLF